MSRRLATRLRLVGGVVALAMGLGLGVGGCGGASQSPVGDVIMTLTVPNGVQVQSAQFTIDDKVHPPAVGIVGGPQPEAQFVELIPHLPVSDQYVMTVQAESTDGQMVCSGSAPMKVMNGVTTRVQIALTCGGHVLVAIGVSCLDTPLVNLRVSPLEASVGSAVEVSADPARPDAGALTFTWSAPSGTFSDPGASQTTFTCTKAGLVEITLQVEDDELCQQSDSAMVTCLGPDGGVPPGGLMVIAPPDGGPTDGGVADGGRG
jgi:hypothetical protein